MTLDELGWRGERLPLEAASERGERVGRVAVEHRSGYALYAESGEVWAGLSGRLRREVERGEGPGRPAVGDWVAYRPDPAGEGGSIRAVLPRRGVFARKAAGRASTVQVMAANVDVALIVTALPGDLNPRRLERYLALAREGGIEPAVVLSKADLVDDPEDALRTAAVAAPGVPVHAVSVVRGDGLEELAGYFTGHRTVALLGSSGVGKSTLINRLLGRESRRTEGVRDDGRGRHTTTARELIARPGGGLVIDTPGLRELALWEAGSGLASTFVDVEDFAPRCRFRDCTHRTEPGCAVLAAVSDGRLPAERLASYHKLRGELAHLEMKVDALARTESKRSVKSQMKAARDWYKQKKRW